MKTAAAAQQGVRKNARGEPVDEGQWFLRLASWRGRPARGMMLGMGGKHGGYGKTDANGGRSARGIALEG